MAYSNSKVIFLTSSPQGGGEVPIDDLRGAASLKMQVLPAYLASKRLGHHPIVFSSNTKKPEQLNNIGYPLITFVCKINHPNDLKFEEYALGILASIARLKARGSKVVVLYSDHLASYPGARGFLYQDLLNLADHIVTPCEAAKANACEYKNENTTISVIEDPWQTKLQDFPSIKDDEPLRIAWFGNDSNRGFLKGVISDLMKNLNTSRNYEFNILGSMETLLKVKEKFEEEASQLKSYSVNFHTWNDNDQPGQLENFLKTTHIVLLPSNPSVAMKTGISHNRLVDAVRSGCIVIASPMKSYLEMKQICLISNNMADTINQTEGHINRLGTKYSLLREKALARFDPQENSKKWEQLIKKILI